MTVLIYRSKASLKTWQFLLHTPLRPRASFSRSITDPFVKRLTDTFRRISSLLMNNNLQFLLASTTWVVAVADILVPTLISLSESLKGTPRGVSFFHTYVLDSFAQLPSSFSFNLTSRLFSFRGSSLLTIEEAMNLRAQTSTTCPLPLRATTWSFRRDTFGAYADHYLVHEYKQTKTSLLGYYRAHIPGVHSGCSPVHVAASTKSTPSSPPTSLCNTYTSSAIAYHRTQCYPHAIIQKRKCKELWPQSSWTRPSHCLPEGMYFTCMKLKKF